MSLTCSQIRPMPGHLGLYFADKVAENITLDAGTPDSDGHDDNHDKFQRSILSSTNRARVVLNANVEERMHSGPESEASEECSCRPKARPCALC